MAMVAMRTPLDTLGHNPSWAPYSCSFSFTSAPFHLHNRLREAERTCSRVQSSRVVWSDVKFRPVQLQSPVWALLPLVSDVLQQKKSSSWTWIEPDEEAGTVVGGWGQRLSQPAAALTPMGGLGPNFLLGSRDQMKSVDYCGLMLIHRIVINWWFWYVEKEGRPVPTGHMPYTQHDRLWTCCSVRSGESSDRSSECQHQGRTLIRSPFRKSCSADKEFKVRTLNSIVKT